MRAKPCSTCRQQILLAKRAEDVKKWIVLDAHPTPPAQAFDAREYRMLDGRHAYRLAHLQESLELRREISPASAHDVAVDDFAWHHVHHCTGDDS